MVKASLSLKLENKVSLNLVLKDAVSLLELQAQELENYIRREMEENPLLQDFIIKDQRRYEVDFLSNIAYEKSPYEEFEEELERNFFGRKLEIAKQLFSFTDESGFLKEDLENIAKVLNVEKSELESVRKEMMMLEPFGVCAKDRREFLEFQVKFILKDEELLRKLKEGKLEEEDIKRLKKLRLSPFLEKRAQFVPSKVDVVIEIDGQEIYYHIYEENFDIRISPHYLELYKRDKKVREYLRRYLKRLDALATALKIRKKNLKAIVEEIVKRQRDFFLSSKPLKPMLLSELCEKTSLSLSTLSRLVNSKFVKTPFGIYKLRDFFTRGVCKELSKDELKGIIKKLVEEEDKRAPLSDEKISKILKGMGYKVSRRTITKYRLLLKIPPSHLRKNV